MPSNNQKEFSSVQKKKSHNYSSTHHSSSTNTPHNMKPVVKKNYSGSDIMNERIQFFFLSLLGYVVVVHVSPHGHAYEGLFYAFKSNKENNTFSIILRSVRAKTINKLKDYDSQQKLIDTFEIASSEILQIVAKDITFAREERVVKEEAFMTDTQISGNANQGAGRELIKWEGEDMYDPNSPHFYGELRSSSFSSEPFDMYKVNEKFGVRSTYKEELYTTPLDKSDAELVKKASAIAKEIEGSDFMSDNVHIREDRGYEDDSGLTEEQKYSTVFRPEGTQQLQRKPLKGKTVLTGTTPNAYIPPHFRNAADKKPQQKEVSKETPTKPTEGPEKQQKPSPTVSQPIESQKTESPQETVPTPTSTPVEEKKTQKTLQSEESKKRLNPNAKEFNPVSQPFTPYPMFNVVAPPYFPMFPSPFHHHQFTMPATGFTAQQRPATMSMHYDKRTTLPPNPEPKPVPK